MTILLLILKYLSMSKNNPKSPKGKMVEIEGIRYLLIDGKIYRYADLTLNKGFKIVLGRPGSEEVLKHLLNRLLGLRIARLEYRNTEHPGMAEGRAQGRAKDTSSLRLSLFDNSEA